MVLWPAICVTRICTNSLVWLKHNLFPHQFWLTLQPFLWYCPCSVLSIGQLVSFCTLSHEVVALHHWKTNKGADNSCHGNPQGWIYHTFWQEVWLHQHWLPLFDMFYSERWQDEALQQPAHEQEISSMHLLRCLVKYKLTLNRESRLWGKIYLRLIKSLLTPKIWLLILPSCCCYTFPSKLVTGILCTTKLISSSWWVWVFSLPVYWIMYKYYKEKLHVNHFWLLDMQTCMGYSISCYQLEPTSLNLNLFAPRSHY